MIAIVSSSTEALLLAKLTDAQVIETPRFDVVDESWGFAEMLDEWRGLVIKGPQHSQVIVAPWVESLHAGTLDDIAMTNWIERFEAPLAMWTAALGAASRLCADGGVIVAVVDKPSPLDTSGWLPETAVADAVEALVRSLARSEGKRGVRVNAVTTPCRTSLEPVVAPAPSLRTFPGTVDIEVAGAVRLLFADDACGLTGVVLSADCGRSWR